MTATFPAMSIEAPCHSLLHCTMLTPLRIEVTDIVIRLLIWRRVRRGSANGRIPTRMSWFLWQNAAAAASRG